MKSSIKTKSLTILSIFAVALIPLSGCGAGDTNEPSVITVAGSAGSSDIASGDVVVTGKAGSNLEGKGDEKVSTATTEWETSSIEIVTPQKFNIDVTSVPDNGYDSKIKSNIPEADAKEVNKGKAVAMTWYLSLGETERLKLERDDNAKPDGTLLDDPAFDGMISPKYKPELAKQLQAGTVVPMSDVDGLFKASQGKSLQVAKNGWETAYNPEVYATFEQTKELGATVKFSGNRNDIVTADDGTKSVDEYSFTINMTRDIDGNWEVVQAKTIWDFGTVTPAP